MKTSRVCSDCSVRAAFALLFAVGLLSFGASDAFAQGNKGGPAPVGSPVTNADGSTTQNYRGGSSVTTYPHGTTVRGGEDDGGDITYPPGTTRTTRPSDNAGRGGSQDTYKTPPRGGQGGRTDTFTRDRDGHVRSHQSHKYYPDGSTTDSSFGYRADGSMIGGTTEIHNADGTTITRERTVARDGTTTEVTKIDGREVQRTTTGGPADKAGKEAAKEAGKEIGREAGRDAAKDAAKDRRPEGEKAPPSCGSCP